MGKLAGGFGRFLNRLLSVRGKRDLIVNPTATREFFLPARLRTETFDNPYKQHSWVYACIDAISRDISRVPWVIKSGDRKDAQLVEVSPWNTIFDRPCPSVTRVQFWKLGVILLERDGEWAIVKESGRDQRLGAGEIPRELWPISGKLFDPVVESPGSARIIAWLYHPPNGQIVKYLPHEIVFVKHADPDNPLRGLAPLDAALMAARQDYKASLFNEAFLDNDASPGGVLVTQRQLTPDQRRDYRAAWEDRHAGTSRKGRIAVLEGGMTFTPQAVSYKDMAFMEQRKWNREEIMAVFGVPKFVLALYEDMNFATAKEAARFYHDSTLDPIMCLIEETLWPELFRPVESGRYWGEFDRSAVDSLQERIEIKLANAQAMLQLGYPVNWINERLDLGMPSLPPEIGDEPMMPAGMIPASEVLLPKTEEIPAKETPQKKEPEVEEEAQEEQSGGESGHEAGSPLCDKQSWAWVCDSWKVRRVEGADAPRPPSSAVVSHEWVRACVDRFLSTRSAKSAYLQQKFERLHLRPMELRFRGAVRRFLMALRAEQLGRIEDMERCSTLTGTRESYLADKLRAEGGAGTIVFDAMEWAEKLAQITDPAYRASVEGALDVTFDELGGNFSGFDSADPRMVEIVQARKPALVGVTDTIRQRVGKSIEAGITAGESIAEMQDRIRGDFNAFSRSRSLTIARTEVGSVSSQSRFEAFKEEGIETHEWVSAGDEAVRHSHREANGQTVKVGTHFTLTDAKGGISRLMHPNDPAGPAREVINCWAPGTLVVTRWGDRAIEDVVSGDEVLTHRHSFRVVTERHISTVPQEIVEVILGNGRALRLTPNHELFVVQRGWIAAGSLVAGDTLMSRTMLIRSGISVPHPHPEYRDAVMDTATARRVASASQDPSNRTEMMVRCLRPVAEKATVYNLGVERDASYFAGGVLGKNCRCIAVKKS